MGNVRIGSRRRPSAPTLVRWYAYAGCCALVVFGLSGIAARPWYTLIALLAGIGLLLGLVRPWGLVLPRWTPRLAGRAVPRLLPLALAWVLAPTLVFFGTGSLLLDAGGSGGAAALGAYGWALAVAAVSYQKRTRPGRAVRLNLVERGHALGRRPQQVS